jgi:uncharacterized small protein (DUF1192 family)
MEYTESSEMASEMATKQASAMESTLARLSKELARLSAITDRLENKTTIVCRPLNPQVEGVEGQERQVLASLVMELEDKINLLSTSTARLESIYDRLDI